MARWWIARALAVSVLVLSALPCARAADTGQAAAGSKPASTTISGKIVILDVDSFSPELTISDSSGQQLRVMLDPQTSIKEQDRLKQRSDLRIGQTIQVVGDYKPLLGQYLAKTITIAQQPTPAAPSAAPSQTAEAAKPKAAPSVLKSVEASDKTATSSASPPPPTPSPSKP